MKTEFIGNREFSESDMPFTARKEIDKELARRVYFATVNEFLLVNFDEIKQHNKIDFDTALREYGKDNEFRYLHLFSSDIDFEAALVVLSLADLITSAVEIKYMFIRRRNLYMSIRTEKGLIIFETFSEEVKCILSNRNINEDEDCDEPDVFLAYGFKIRRD
jgi:hypothetical protein